MGDRVSQSGAGDFGRATRMKKASQSAFPTPLNPSNLPLPQSSACSPRSCPVPPATELYWENVDSPQTRAQLLEQTFQSSPDGLSIADCEHRVIWANETFARMFGYDAREIVGQPLENLVVPPDRLAESRWVTEALAKGERITLDTQRRKKDGSLLDVCLS